MLAFLLIMWNIKKRKRINFKLIIYNYLTGTIFPISNKSGFTGTTIRPGSILTVGFGVTDRGSNTALVDIYRRNAKPLTVQLLEVGQFEEK